MTIPTLRTPGIYAEINTNTQRSGLPANNHKILILTADSGQVNPVPVAVYDKASADVMYGANSIAGRMITAAIKTNRFVNVEVFAVQAGQPGGV